MQASMGWRVTWALFTFLSLFLSCDGASLHNRSPEPLKNPFAKEKTAAVVYPELREGTISGYLWNQKKMCIVKKGPQDWRLMSVYLDAVVQMGLRWQADKVPGARLVSVAMDNLEGDHFEPFNLEKPATVVTLIFVRVLDSLTDEGLQQTFVWSYELAPEQKPTVQVRKAVAGSRYTAASLSFVWKEPEVGSLARVIYAMDGLQTDVRPETRYQVIDVRRRNVSSPVTWMAACKRGTADFRFDLFRQTPVIGSETSSSPKPFCFASKKSKDKFVESQLRQQAQATFVHQEQSIIPINANPINPSDPQHR